MKTKIEGKKLAVDAFFAKTNPSEVVRVDIDTDGGTHRFVFEHLGSSGVTVVDWIKPSPADEFEDRQRIVNLDDKTVRPTEEQWDELEKMAQFLGYRNIGDFLVRGMQADGAHHKQWYLERLAKAFGIDLSSIDYEKGVAP